MLYASIIAGLQDFFNLLIFKFYIYFCLDSQLTIFIDIHTHIVRIHCEIAIISLGKDIEGKNTGNGDIH